MCVVSFVGDRIAPSIPNQYPWVQPYVADTRKIVIGVPQEEFDALKREVEALRKLLLAAKEYDDETGQPDCEQAEKVALIRRLAELVDVDMTEVFPGEWREYNDSEMYYTLTATDPRVV